MLIKEMKCEVEAAYKEAFSKAQSRWEELKYVNGFIKQAGGWRKNENGMFTAIVVGGRSTNIRRIHDQLT